MAADNNSQGLRSCIIPHTPAVRAIAMLASQKLRAVTLTSCSNDAQMSLRASFCLADWATLPVVASAASPASTDTCLLKASATLSALCCPCTKAHYLVLGKVNLPVIMIQPDGRIANCMRKTPMHASVQHTEMQCVRNCSISSIHYDHALQVWPEGNDCRTATADRQAMQSYLAGAKESQQECNRICFDMATPSCVFMLHNGWKQSCCTQQCTARHDVLKKLPAQAKRGFKNSTTVQAKSHTLKTCECQACSIGNSYGHLDAANWHERCALMLCQ